MFLLGKSPWLLGEHEIHLHPLPTPQSPSLRAEETRQRVAGGEFMPDLSPMRDPSAAGELAPNPRWAGWRLLFEGVLRVLRWVAPCVAVSVPCTARGSGSRTAACSSGGTKCAQIPEVPFQYGAFSFVKETLNTPGHTRTCRALENRAGLFWRVLSHLNRCYFF